MISDTLSLFAKLLSTENIKVVFKDTTPSFDTDKRILTLPHVDDSQGLGSMFVTHEVGHALFTDNTIYQKNNTRIKPFFKYVNIIEDARIENRMKDCFPGATKVLYKGYTQLLHLKKTNDDSPLIDRINEHFSFGYRAGVTFSPDEQIYVDRIAGLQSLQDSIDLAEELWEHQTTHDSDNPSDSKNSGDSGNSDTDTDTDNQTFYDMKDGAIAESYTDDLPTSCGVKTIGDIYTKRYEGWKEVFYRVRDISDLTNPTIEIENIKNVTNHMVNVFEMRKSAKLSERNQKSKNGIIDVNRLSSYRYSDEIFKSIGINEKSKNHGVVMLLDWSTSMEGVVLNEVIKQTVFLCNFLRNLKIPFVVAIYSTGGVVEILSSDMKNKDFINMCNFLLCEDRRRILGHGTTPTFNSLVVMHGTINKFIETHQIDKLVFICLTDGDEDDIGTYELLRSNRNGKIFGSPQGLSQFDVVDLIKNDYDAVCIGYSVSTQINQIAVGYICPDMVDSDTIKTVVQKHGWFVYKPTHAYNVVYCMGVDTGLKDNKAILKHIVEIIA